MSRVALFLRQRRDQFALGWDTFVPCPAGEGLDVFSATGTSMTLVSYGDPAAIVWDTFATSRFVPSIAAGNLVPYTAGTSLGVYPNRSNCGSNALVTPGLLENPDPVVTADLSY